MPRRGAERTGNTWSPMSLDLFGEASPERRIPRRVRRMPIPGLLLYYAALVAVWFALDAALGSTGIATLTPLRSGDPVPRASELPRPLLATLAVTGALLLVLPVAAVYMRTRRLRYDPSLVHTLVMLPVVAAGILLVVENSLARAFSLAGIVAAIRFRNTLPEPRDVVYVLLALGIGLAAGGMALDVALIMSGLFNVLALVLWGFNIGSIYATGSARQGILSVGERGLLIATTPAARSRLRHVIRAELEGMRPDGLLVLHTQGDSAEVIADEVIFENTRQWRLLGEIGTRRGVRTLAYLVQLRRAARPAELLAGLDECSVQVLAAEYLPLSREQLERGGHGRNHHERSEHRLAQELVGAGSAP